MKKIIAISVMLALIVGAVFADTAVGGAVETRMWLFQKNVKVGDDWQSPDAEPIMGGTIGAAQIQLTGSNADGTLGGMFKFKNTMSADTGANGFDRVFVWWKPVPQVKVFLGIDQDGLFDTASIVSWGYHAGDNDYLFNHHWDFWRMIFPGNWDGFGMALSFYPVPGFDFNVVLPTGGVNYRQSPKANVEKKVPLIGDNNTPDEPKDDGMFPARLRFQGGYSFDFGRIQFAYNGSAVTAEKGDPGVRGYGGWGKNNGLFGASFLLTALEGIQVLVGGSVILADPDMFINGGLGVVYNGDGFGVKARAGLHMHGDDDMFITGSIMPFFSVGEKAQVLVDVIVTTVGDEMGWGLYPVLRLPIDGGAFKIGLQIFNNLNMGGDIRISGNKETGISIPMLLSFNF
jgi:hypothetical protein